MLHFSSEGKLSYADALASQPTPGRAGLGRLVTWQPPLRDAPGVSWLEKRTWIIWHTRTPSGEYSPIWYPDTIASVTLGRESYGKILPFSCSYLSFSTTETVPTKVPQVEPKLPLEYNVLHFWTISCFFEINDSRKELSSMHGRGAREIIGRSGKNCGIVWVDKGDQISAPEPDEARCEAILLSKSQSSRPSSGFKDSYYVEGSYRSYNIMLLKWDSAGGVAERRGIGTIITCAVTGGFQSGPVWKEILLA
jgi:hypothetical protein